MNYLGLAAFALTLIVVGYLIGEVLARRMDK